MQSSAVVHPADPKKPADRTTVVETVRSYPHPSGALSWLNRMLYGLLVSYISNITTLLALVKPTSCAE